MLSGFWPFIFHLDVYFSFDFGSYSIHFDIVRLKQGVGARGGGGRGRFA